MNIVKHGDKVFDLDKPLDRLNYALIYQDSANTPSSGGLINVRQSDLRWLLRDYYKLIEEVTTLRETPNG